MAFPPELPLFCFGVTVVVFLGVLVLVDGLLVPVAGLLPLDELVALIL